jgi:hypothetical protein
LWQLLFFETRKKCREKDAFFMIYLNCGVVDIVINKSYILPGLEQSFAAKNESFVGTKQL